MINGVVARPAALGGGVLQLPAPAEQRGVRDVPPTRCLECSLHFDLRQLQPLDVFFAHGLSRVNLLLLVQQERGGSVHGLPDDRRADDLCHYGEVHEDLLEYVETGESSLAMQRRRRNGCYLRASCCLGGLQVEREGKVVGVLHSCIFQKK